MVEDLDEFVPSLLPCPLLTHVGSIVPVEPHIICLSLWYVLEGEYLMAGTCPFPVAVGCE